MAKILIVEDNQGTNKAICEYMKEAGHTLFSAFTGSEALKIFREKYRISFQMRSTIRRLDNQYQLYLIKISYQFLTNVAYYHPNSYNTYLSHFIVQI